MFFTNNALKFKYQLDCLKFKHEDSRVLQNVSIYHTTALQPNTIALILIQAQH